MLKTFRPFEAPVSYYFVDPDTDHRFQGQNKEDLLSQIIAYRAQNNLTPLEGLGYVVDNYLCSQPENAGKWKTLPDIPQGFLTYLKGGVLLLKAKLLNNYAPQAVADERAEQCSRCPFNSFPDRGPFMVWIEDVAVSCVGKRRAVLNDQLGLCAVCQCPLRSKVFYNEELPKFTPKQVERMQSVNCWQLKLANQ